MGSFKQIFLIAQNTFREIVRDRFFYICIGVAFLFLFFSFIMGKLSFLERTRITINLGLSAIQLITAFSCIFIGSSLISKEVEKRTILTLLARPLNRWHFLFGKAFGLISVMLFFVLIVSLSLFLVIYTSLIQEGMIWVYFVSVYGILLEAMVLIAFTLFWSSFNRPFLSVFFSLILFIIGHWLKTLHFLIEKSESQLFVLLGEFFLFALPDLEKFNWKSFVVYKKEVSLNFLFSSSLYAFVWFSFFLAITSLILRRRNFD